MYFPDLAPYLEYNSLGTLAVGWLDIRHPYPQGETSAQFRECLFSFCLHAFLRTRGLHKCEFCDPKSYVLPTAVSDGKQIRMGSAVIRVIYGWQIYAAPDMIYHYVVDHHYRPPDEFVEAVIHGFSPESAEYAELRHKYWNY